MEWINLDRALRGTSLNPQLVADDLGLVVVCDADAATVGGACWFGTPNHETSAALADYRDSGGTVSEHWAPSDRAPGPTTHVALLDTNAGLLWWIGPADSHEAAIRAHLTDAGYDEDSDLAFVAVDATDTQAAVLSAWWDAGAAARDYPTTLPEGKRYDSEQVAAMMAASAS